MPGRKFMDGYSTEKQYMHALYDEFIGLMITTARKYESDPNEVEDIIQDSLLKLIPKASILQEMERCVLAAYIVSTVRNTSINHLKKKSISVNYNAKEEDLSEIPADTLRLDELLVLREKKNSLMRVWPSLPEEDRIILEGKYILGYTDLELANELKIKPSSIRMKLTRARRKALYLMNSLEGENHND